MPDPLTPVTVISTPKRSASSALETEKVHALELSYPRTGESHRFERKGDDWKSADPALEPKPVPLMVIVSNWPGRYTQSSSAWHSRVDCEGRLSRSRAFGSAALREIASAPATRGVNDAFDFSRTEPMTRGEPIVPIERFIDGYQSRNERLADLMRRMGICEEKSSGIDRVIHAAEFRLSAGEIAEIDAWRRTEI